MTTLTVPTSFAAAWLTTLRQWFGNPSSTEPAANASAAELLRRAEAYQSTQPGYAADLRAAAQQMADTAA